jgi:predicted PurR-regulated permease PerM
MTAMNAIAKPLRVLIFVALTFVGLYYAQGVLVPFCFGGLFAMLFLPVSRRLESKGIKRWMAALACVIIFLIVLAGLVSLLAWQFTDLAKDITGIEQKVKDFIGEIRRFIQSNLGISEEQQKKLMEEQRSSGAGRVGGLLSSAASSFMGALLNFVLVMVYFFLILFYRAHIRQFMLRVAGSGSQQKANTIMERAGKVAQQYLTGLALMIICLWILYGIGFSIIGVKHAIFFAILCGLLEIVPFVGNITGTGLTVIYALSQGADMGMVIGIVGIYAIIQFFQTYVLEPLVVGAEVNINPLFTILVLVIGEALWGIAGMILAIPLTGIVKIICDHVEILKPYGFLLGKTTASLKQKRRKEK